MPSVKDIESWARARGIPVEQAFQELGMKVERTMQPAADALKQMQDNAMEGIRRASGIIPQPVPPPPPDPNRNGQTLLNQEGYQQDLSQRLKQIGAAETEKQQNMDNFNPDDYTKYSMGGEVAPHDENLGKPKFNHLNDMMKRHKKANSEIEASANPMKFIKDNKNMSIKGKKGVAF